MWIQVWLTQDERVALIPMVQFRIDAVKKRLQEVCVVLASEGSTRSNTYAYAPHDCQEYEAGMAEVVQGKGK